MTDVVLCEIDVGPAVARAVLTRVHEEIRMALSAGGHIVGEEIIEIRWGEETVGQPVLSERPAVIGVDEVRALVFGALPGPAVSAEAVTLDGERVACAIGEGVWLALVPDDPRARYPVLFRDADGAPVNPGLPADWDREGIGERERACPACEANTWDLVTAGWQGTGALRNTRWGYIGGSDPKPGRAFVCRGCGYEERLGARISHRRP